MTSIKCSHCGLVNFSTEPHCKRCKNPIATTSTNRSPVHDFQSPPPPPTFNNGIATYQEQEVPPCIKCGNRQNIAVQGFVKFYNSPVAILGIFIGILPYLLLKILLRTRHDLTAPFCQGCWAKFRNARTYDLLNGLLFFPIMIGGIIFSIATDSEWLLLGSFLFPFLVFAVGKFYVSSISPKYKRVTAKEVVIQAPFVGEIVYSK